MLPIALTLAVFNVAVPLLFLATFALAFSLAAALAYGLRARFVRSFIDADLTVRSTHRSLSKKAQGYVHKLGHHGFALLDVVAVTDGSGRVLTRPLAVAERPHDSQVAICSDLGQQLVSPLVGESLLLTSSHDVVQNDKVYAQRLHNASASELVAMHDAAVSTIEERHLDRDVDPLANVLAIERYEQQTMRNVGGMNHRKLVDVGLEPLATVGEWISDQQFQALRS